MRRSWIAVLLLVAATGCSLGPEIVSPDAVVASKWIEPTASSSEPPVIEWWKTLEDPTLVAYADAALAANHDIRIAVARVREARASRRVAAGGHYPDVGAGGGATRLRGSENGFGPVPELVREGFGSLEGNVYDIGVEASWEIDIFGATRSAVDAASARVEAAVENRRDVQLLAVSEVALAYVELRGAQERLAVAEDNVRIQTETLEFVEDQRTAGFASELEVSQARSQLRTTEAAIPRLRATIRRSAYRLAVLTGRLPADVLQELLVPSPLPPFPTEVPMGHPPELLLRRPDLRRAERELAASQLDIGVATAELYPRFFVRGAIGLEATSPSDLLSLSSGTGLIGAFFRWPIFRRGEIRAQIEASHARADAALARYEQAVLVAVEDVEGALVGYVEEKNVLDRLQEARADAERARELARSLYRLGLADFLIVLDAERRLREVDDQVTRSETNVRTRLVRLYKSLGGGWEAIEQQAS
jgi:NodT family efflux transporter outer membrane factor (OMF) lipoprotein